MLIQLIKAHPGFSLLEMVVVVGMMGAASLGVMRLIENQNKGQKKLAHDFEANLIRNSIVTLFSDPDTCQTNLVPGYNAANPTTSPGTPTYNPKGGGAVLRNSIYKKNMREVFKVGQSIAKGSKGELIFKEFRVADYDSSSGTANLLIKFQKKGRSDGGDTVLRKILLFVQLDGGSKIKSCKVDGTETSQIRKVICENDFAGIWNEQAKTCGSKTPEFSKVTTRQICMKTVENKLECLNRCGSTIYFSTENNYCCDQDICVKDKLYLAGDWVKLVKHRYDQNDRDGNWANLQHKLLILPFTACAIRAHSYFDDGGFVAAFETRVAPNNSQALRLGLWWRHAFRYNDVSTNITLTNKANRADVPCRFDAPDEEGNVSSYSSSPVSYGPGQLEWCGWARERSAGNAQNDGDVFNMLATAKDTEISIYSTHSIGKSTDHHKYEIEFQICP